jgi:hypothetical protein
MALYRCPTAELTPGILTAHYVGIMGPTGTNPFKPDASGNPTPYGYTAATQWALDGAMPPVAPTPPGKLQITDLKDGTSSTILWAEAAWPESKVGSETPPTWWWYVGCDMTPTSPTYGMCGSTRNVTALPRALAFDGTSNLNNVSLGSAHQGGFQVGMGDGSVQFLNEEIDILLLKALASRNGRERAAIP